MNSGLTRARALVTAIFATSGVFTFTWLARIPTLRDELSLSLSSLGLVMLISSFGTLVSVATAGWSLQRWGNARVFLVMTWTASLGYALSGVATAYGDVALFVLGNLVANIGVGTMGVVANVESARVERAYGKPILPTFHATYSAAAVAGSLIGGACSWLQIPIWAQFSGIAACALLLRLWALRAGMILPESIEERFARTAPRTAKPSAWKAWVEPRTLLIGVIPLASSFSEGSANNWLSIAVVDSFQQLESTGAVMLGVFIGAMTLVRSLGYTLISHLGRAHTLQLSLIVSLFGLAAFGAAPNFTVAAIGIAAWGFGAALCFPICVAAVSEDAAMAAARVSVMVSMSSVAAIIAPPALGNIATSIGARGALMLVPIALIACLLVAGKTEPDPAPIYSDVSDPVTA